MFHYQFQIPKNNIRLFIILAGLARPNRNIPRNSHRLTMSKERDHDGYKRSRNEQARGIECEPLLALSPREHIPIEQDKSRFNAPQLSHISQSKEIYKLPPKPVSFCR